MPSTVVHLAFGIVLATALLGDAVDRRMVGLLVAIIVAPELDTAVGLFLAGAHRSLLHNLMIPVAAAGLLYYDTRVRRRSWVADRWGRWGVRLAWSGLFVHVFAHVLLDYAHLEGVNLFYPLVDRFFRLEGELYISSTDGFVQTFVEVTEDPVTGERSVDVGGGGTTRDTHVASPVDPGPEQGPDTRDDRRFPIAVWGWQLYLIALAGFTAMARRLQDRGRIDDR